MFFLCKENKISLIFDEAHSRGSVCLGCLRRLSFTVQFTGVAVTTFSLDNAWKAPRKVPIGKLDEDVKAIKAILNQITPNCNIERLTGEIRKLALNTEDEMHAIITTLYDRAVSEPLCTRHCAAICVTMNTVKVRDM